MNKGLKDMEETQSSRTIVITRKQKDRWESIVYKRLYKAKKLTLWLRAKELFEDYEDLPSLYFNKFLTKNLHIKQNYNKQDLVNFIIFMIEEKFTVKENYDR